MAAPETGAREDFRAPWRVFWVAFLVRVLYITIAHTYRFRPIEHHFGFGWEMGRIARALVNGRGYADPFRGHTGPTSWVAPLYPLLMAGVFKVCGVYTYLSGWVILTINSLFSAFTACFTWEIGSRAFGRKVGLWAGWIWALYPAAMQYAVRWPWEMTLTTFLFAWSLVLALRMRGIGEGEAAGAACATMRRWAGFGLLWGLIALSNPSLLLFLPVAGIWILMGNRPEWKRQVASVVVGTAVCLACLAPWTIRNTRVFHHFVPLRANFGVEFYLGNGPGSTGLLMGYDHPFMDPVALREYKAMGEYDYAQMQGAKAKAYIRAHPGHFVKDCVKRVYYFWFSVPHPEDDGRVTEWGRLINFGFTSLAGLLGLGLALQRRAPAAWLFFFAFLLLPLVYYAVTVHARFRHPLEPLIAVLGVYLFQSAERRGRVLAR
jgi:4-amino-4-deoxy-L-arabinose transferase-like glycosyltransferase